MSREITVLKRNPAGQETWRYTGTLLRREPRAVLLEAYFNRPDFSLLDTVIREKDRFIETYFTDRWYNVYEIRDRDDDRVKGWYCNVARPAVWEAENQLSFVDLALDLWVDPQGRQTVLDEDEFAALDLDAATRRQARAALKELKRLFASAGKPGLPMPIRG
jgi:predicted RNA-binding protein associated with RNAse of E/G family